MVTASAMEDRLRYAFDGDIRTKWLSAAPQVGGEWVRLSFGEDVDIGRLVVLTSPFGVGDYPRGLVVESEAADGGRMTLLRGLVPAGAARGARDRCAGRAGGAGPSVEPEPGPLGQADGPVGAVAVGDPRAAGLPAPCPLSSRPRPGTCIVFGTVVSLTGSSVARTPYLVTAAW